MSAYFIQITQKANVCIVYTDFIIHMNACILYTGYSTGVCILCTGYPKGECISNTTGECLFSLCRLPYKRTYLHFVQVTLYL